MPKELDFQTVRNIRDLGGYKTKDNKTVKYGLLYRGVTVSNLTSDKDIQKFLDLHIKTVFDLRSKSEVEEKPDPKLPGTRYIREPGMIFLGNDSIDFSPEGINRLLNSDAAKKYNLSPDTKPEDVFNLMYRKMLRNDKTFKKLFDVLLDKEVPLYFHCAAGKDRTGAAAVLILLALGVSREDAIKDYLYTNECYKEKVEALYVRFNLKPGENADLDEMVRNNYTVSADFFNKELDDIEKEYGSIENFLDKLYGLKERELKYLRDTYCE